MENSYIEASYHKKQTTSMELVLLYNILAAQKKCGVSPTNHKFEVILGAESWK